MPGVLTATYNNNTGPQFPIGFLMGWYWPWMPLQMECIIFRLRQSRQSAVKFCFQNAWTNLPADLLYKTGRLCIYSVNHSYTTLKYFQILPHGVEMSLIGVNIWRLKMQINKSLYVSISSPHLHPVFLPILVSKIVQAVAGKHQFCYILSWTEVWALTGPF